MADDDTTTDPGLEDRVESLESGQSKILGKLDELLAGGSKPADLKAGDPDAPSGRPATVEEQVRAELARRDKEAADKQAADADQEERKTLKQQVADMAAKLTEAKPVQPQPRRQRMMWGKNQ